MGFLPFNRPTQFRIPGFRPPFTFKWDLGEVPGLSSSASLVTQMDSLVALDTSLRLEVKSPEISLFPTIEENEGDEKTSDQLPVTSIAQSSSLP